MKSDSLGNIQWQNTIGGSGDDKLYSVKQTVDGGYILGGSSSSFISGDKTEPSTGGHDFWILKTDSTGNIQWQNTIWGSNNDELISIYQTADGGYALGGYSKSFISGDKSENSLMQSIPCYDFWIIKTDPAGSIQWQNTIGGSNDEYLTSFKQTADGGSIIGGRTPSNISGDKTEDGNGSFDYWIVKISNKYNLITGQIFIDLNSNGIHDNGESTLPAQKITEQNTGRFTFSDQNGNYSVLVLDSGNFIVSHHNQ
ncbi:MAG: hypothetical protein IPP46_06025 [Bacteroidetes bacterium]|nr:hypothetical protein [Bacteroidota bacterium]